MTKNVPSLLISLCLLCACASQPVAVSVCPKPAPPSPEMLQPAPPPAAFSKCLREILASPAPISEECSTLLRRAQTK